MPMFTKRNNAARKLTSEQVAEIRRYYEEGATQGSLAKYYKMSAVQIGRIVRGESWASSVDKRMPPEAEMQASAQRMVERQRAASDVGYHIRIPTAPPSPLDGGDAPSAEGGLAAMQQKARELLGK